MKKFSEAVLAKHKHMSHKANPHHAHSMGLEYTPSGKGVVRPIDTADAGYGGEAVSDAEGGEADAGKASKKAVSPMKMPTLVKKTNEETERERLMKLRSFVHQNKLKGMGEEKVDEVNRNKTKTDDYGGRYLDSINRDKKIKELERKISKMSPNDGGGRYLAGRELDKMKAMKEEVEQGRGRLMNSHVAYLRPKKSAPSDVKDHFEVPVNSDSKKGAHGKFAKIFGSSMAKHYEVVHVKPFVKPTVAEEVEQVDEARRMSAAEKLGRAFDSEQQKSADSRRRAQEYMAKIRADVDTKMKKDKEGMKEEAEQVDEAAIHISAEDTLGNTYHIHRRADGSVISSNQNRYVTSPSNYAFNHRGGYAEKSKAVVGIIKKARDSAHAAELLNSSKLGYRNWKPHVNEEAEQVDELKKSTLASYAKKATDDVSYHSFMAGTMSSKDPERLVQDKKAMKRQAGVIKAVDKMAKEEVEQVDEVRYQVVGKTRENETFKSKIHPTKREAQGTHYKMAKSGHYKEINLVKVSEETEQLDELSPEARKNKMRTMGVNAAIQHPKKVEFAGGAIQMYRKALKNLSSKEMGGVAKRLPSVKEENDGTEADQGEYGYEGDMAMSQLKSIIRNAQSLHDHMEPQTDLPEWVQSKITLAADYIQTAADYWRSEKEEAMTEGKAEVRANTHQAIKDFLAKGGVIKKLAPSKATYRPGTALASKMIGTSGQTPGMGRNIKAGKPVVAVEEGKMKDIATSKAEAERILGGPVKPKASAVGGKGQPKNLRNLVSRLATKAMKAGHSVTEEEKKSGKVPRIGPMEKALEEEEVWDKPMPASKKQGSLSPEQKAKAKARAERAGRSYPNMVDNMWASKQ